MAQIQKTNHQPLTAPVSQPLNKPHTTPHIQPISNTPAPPSIHL
jgi:hypothetical protein